MTFPRGGIVQAHAKGGMNEEGTKEWLESIWKKQGLLVWDMFRAHLIDEVKQKMRRLNKDTCITPGMDVCRQRKTNKRQQPDLDIVCDWVKCTRNELSSDTIAFIKCGISNTMDGSEDDAIFKDGDKETCRLV